MSTNKLSDVIAERELDVDGGLERAIVRIGTPEPDRHEGGDWRCRFQIIGLGDDSVLEVFGVDSIQALQLCLQIVEVVLTDAQGTHRLQWVGGEGHGLYRTDNPVVTADE